MAILILNDSKPIEAGRVGNLPSDTMMVCSNCENTNLKAKPAREVWAGGARQQDRWCLDCGHQWVVVLPPIFQAELIPLDTQRRG